jgi:hypothetical protein
VFSIQGWTDDLFTPIESFRQFKYLKSLDPTWPVEVALGDIGHPRAQNNPSTWHVINDQAWGWLQANINRSHDQKTIVSSQQTVCNVGTATNVPIQSLTADTPEGLSAGTLSISFGHGGSMTSATPDPNGAADDPIANTVLSQIGPHPLNCPASAGPAPYTALSPPLASASTYIGLGSVTVPYTLVGPTAQIDARVWDVPPGPAANQAGSAACQASPTPAGCPLLISRGTYRIDVLGGYDTPKGTLRIPFFGNHYRFPVGDRIRLDLTQQDAPYLRPSNVQSAITFGNPTLTLPTRESGTVALSSP